jgi:hypothetical protein
LKDLKNQLAYSSPIFGEEMILQIRLKKKFAFILLKTVLYQAIIVKRQASREDKKFVAKLTSLEF